MPQAGRPGNAKKWQLVEEEKGYAGNFGVLQNKNRVTVINQWNKTLHPPGQNNTLVLRAIPGSFENAVEPRSGDTQNP